MPYNALSDHSTKGIRFGPLLYVVSGDDYYPFEHSDFAVRECIRGCRSQFKQWTPANSELQIVDNAEAQYLAFFAGKTVAMIRAPDCYARCTKLPLSLHCL
jgi:hypothetical protein